MSELNSDFYFYFWVLVVMEGVEFFNLLQIISSVKIKFSVFLYIG